MADAPKSSPIPDGVPSPPEALRRLLDRRPFLMAFLVSMVRDFSLAEELYQDVCLRVCESWGSFKPDMDFGAWALEIARRRALARLRARAQTGAADPPPEFVDRLERAVAAYAAGPHERWAQRKEALRAGFRALPVHLRQLVEARYLQDLAPEKIAERLGREGEAVREMLARARAEIEAHARRRAEGGEPA